MRQPRLYSPFTPYLFLFPFFFVFGVFIAYPLLQSVLLSLQQTHGAAFTEFVFLHNFHHLFRDPLFWTALRNTLLFASASLFIQFPLALGIALLLNQSWVRGRVFFRLIFFSPALVGPVFVAMIFGLLFQKRVGLINVALNQAVGLNPDFPWLERYVAAAIVLASLWMYLGLNMVFFLAALQSVDEELLDASRIDGAGPWKRFLNVPLPAIRPVAGFVVLLSLIGSFQLFELPFLLLNNGPGPDNRGLTVVMYLYQNGFEMGNLGYASAIGWVLAILLMVLTMIQRVLFGRKEAWDA